jgi:DNA-binding MarR family transcriptional regulator
MSKKEINIDFENSIGPWLGKTVKLVDYFLQESLNEHNLGLTKEQVIVLKRLHDQDGMNQNELAFITLRNKSSLTRLLTNMEGNGYIIRKKSVVDKRIKHVYLTKYGKETFIKIRPVLKNVMSTLEQDVTEQEKAQIINILKKIQHNFNSKIESI